MAQTKKLHLGCGTIYLKGYINIDVEIPDWSFLAADNPELVEANLTTVDDYYGGPNHKHIKRSDFETKKFERRAIVCDVFADARNLPYNPNSVEEIRSVQLFEHFSFKEGESLLTYWHQLLNPGGIVHIDIPDLDGTIELYTNANSQKDRDWAVRLLFGSQKNKFGFHKAMYSKTTIKRLLKSVGFKNIKFLPNIHVYPAFAVEATK